MGKSEVGSTKASKEASKVLGETQHVDGNVAAAARGFISSIVCNEKVFYTILIVSALVAAAGWAFAPSLWEGFMNARQTEPNKLPILAPLVTLAALLATSVPVWLQLHKGWLDQRLAAERTASEAELITLIHSFLSPCIATLPNVAKPGREGKEALVKVQQSILATVQQVCGPNGSGVRVVWFGVEKQTLVPRDWVGGTCNSTRRFTKRSNDKAGQKAWETAKTGLPVRYADLSKDAPSGYKRGRNSKYETFITCGVLGAEDEVVGMLNVDAPKANDLIEIDEMVVGVCARLLSAAYSLSYTAATL